MKKRIQASLSVMLAAVILLSACSSAGSKKSAVSGTESAASQVSSAAASLSSPSSAAAVTGNSSSPAATAPSAAASDSGSVIAGSRAAAGVSSSGSKKPASQAACVSQKEWESYMKSLSVTDQMLKDSVISKGNTARLAGLFKKAKSGGSIKLAVLGGSITQGFLSSASSKCYASQLHAWLQNKFPESRVDLKNAGIGSTDSIIGVHRTDNDILTYNPDLVVIEFAVNDQQGSEWQKAYEGIIRKILTHNSKTAIVMLFMANYMTGTGYNVEGQQIPLGNRYGIPMISFLDAVNPVIKAGKLKVADILKDGLHPNDKGHAIAAALVCDYLNNIYRNLSAQPVAISAMPAPVTDSSYVDAKLLNNKNLTPQSLGSFKKDDNAFYQFPNGWTAQGGSSPIVFKVHAKKISIMYRKTILDGYGACSVKINGKAAGTLDATFPGGWGDYAKTDLVYNGTEKDVTVEISLSDSSKKFSVLAVLAA